MVQLTSLASLVFVVALAFAWASDSASDSFPPGSALRRETSGAGARPEEGDGAGYGLFLDIAREGK